MKQQKRLTLAQRFTSVVLQMHQRVTCAWIRAKRSLIVHHAMWVQWYFLLEALWVVQYDTLSSQHFKAIQGIDSTLTDKRAWGKQIANVFSKHADWHRKKIQSLLLLLPLLLLPMGFKSLLYLMRLLPKKGSIRSILMHQDPQKLSKRFIKYYAKGCIYHFLNPSPKGGTAAMLSHRRISALRLLLPWWRGERAEKICCIFLAQRIEKTLKHWKRVTEDQSIQTLFVHPKGHRRIKKVLYAVHPLLYISIKGFYDAATLSHLFEKSTKEERVSRVFKIKERLLALSSLDAMDVLLLHQLLCYKSELSLEKMLQLTIMPLVQNAREYFEYHDLMEHLEQAEEHWCIVEQSIRLLDKNEKGAFDYRWQSNAEQGQLNGKSIKTSRCLSGFDFCKPVLQAKVVPNSMYVQILSAWHQDFLYSKEKGASCAWGKEGCAYLFETQMHSLVERHKVHKLEDIAKALMELLTFSHAWGIGAKASQGIKEDFEKKEGDSQEVCSAMSALEQKLKQIKNYQILWTMCDPAPLGIYEPCGYVLDFTKGHGEQSDLWYALSALHLIASGAPVGVQESMEVQRQYKAARRYEHFYGALPVSKIPVGAKNSYQTMMHANDFYIIVLCGWWFELQMRLGIKHPWSSALLEVFAVGSTFSGRWVELKEVFMWLKEPYEKFLQEYKLEDTRLQCLKQIDRAWSHWSWFEQEQEKR